MILSPMILSVRQFTGSRAAGKMLRCALGVPNFGFTIDTPLILHNVGSDQPDSDWR